MKGSIAVSSAASLLMLSNMAYAWSPSDSYVPANVTCPSNFNLIREASGISDKESDWLAKRDNLTTPILKKWLSDKMTNVTDHDSLLSSVFNSNNGSSSFHTPRVAIACSGGGYRAMLSGAGMLSALDNRTDGANEHGLGGILQSATYLAGLSGGNWLTGTLAYNNWTSVQDIVNNMTQSDSIWDISDSIINPGGWNIFSTVDRWDDISDDVQDKKDAGFNVSLTDVWGRALSYNFFPTLKDAGAGYTFSTLQKSDVFENAEMPFIISVADGRYPGTYILDTNSTLFEFNPFEMGSWDPSLNAFADIQYLGTEVDNGKPLNDSACVEGFDNVGFVLGTSSSLFNQFILQLNSTSISNFLKSFIGDFLKDLSEDSDDVALYSPNPFYGSEYYQDNITQGTLSKAEVLYLTDGGEDGENIPLVPLLQQEREVDVIFALDNSADTESSWPAGLSLISTYERQFGMLGKDMAFPYVPDEETFINAGLTDKPTFFGCNASNMTSLEYIPPLIVYVPNKQYSFASNTSTFKMSYSDSERLKMIKNGFEAMSRNNLTEDSNFDMCISCAIIRRSQERLGLSTPKECQQCFDTYCWDGKRDETALSEENSLANSSDSSSISFITTSGSASATGGSSSSSSSSASASSTSSKASSKNAGSSSTSVTFSQLFAFVISITLGVL